MKRKVDFNRNHIAMVLFIFIKCLQPISVPTSQELTYK